MGMQFREFRGYQKHALGTLTLTGTAETARAISPSGISGALLQAYNLSGYCNVAEVWVPFGISYICATSVTTPAAVVTLWKNGAAVTGAGGTITIPIQSSGPNYVFAAFGNYTTTAPAAGDVWSLKVTTSSGAGVINPIDLWYATKQVTGINEGVSL